MRSRGLAWEVRWEAGTGVQPEVSRVSHDGDSLQLSAVTLSYWVRLLMENGGSPSSGDFAAAGLMSIFEKVLCRKGPCGASPVLAALPRDQWLLFFLLWKKSRRTILRQDMTDQGQVLCKAKMRQWDYFENSFKNKTCGYSSGDIFR